MKTLADIKRRCIEGVQIRSTINTRHPDSVGALRTIARVQGNAVACEMEGKDGLFWTYWPKANKVKIVSPNAFRLFLWERQPDDFVEIEIIGDSAENDDTMTGEHCDTCGEPLESGQIGRCEECAIDARPGSQQWMDKIYRKALGGGQEDKS